MSRTILVPIDGSEHANEALDRALEMAEEDDGSLRSIYVVNTERYAEPALSSSELVTTELDEQGMELLEEAASAAGKRGIEMETELRHGIPYEEILSYAEETEAELIVMGEQGHSHSLGDAMGRVAKRVTSNATIPVLTV